MNRTQIKRKPSWMRTTIPSGKNFAQIRDILKENNLHTICTSGLCPNKGECWNAGTATFMILGDICTRSCKFCATITGKPEAIDKDEPQKLADAIKKLNLKHCVLTSVDRDDLEDGGASHWANVINEIKRVNPEVTIEALIPDFDGNISDIDTVIKTGAEIISHNLETVRRLTPEIRSKANFDTSLKVLSHLAKSGVRAKTGLMLGIGETRDEILSAMDEMISAGVEVLTLGQYLQPTPKHIPIIDFIHPDIFAEYERIGLEKGFLFVESGPLVRSSYHAEKHIK